MQDRLVDFNEAGVAVAASTYDKVNQNATFKSSEELTYPLLSDQEAKTVKSLGILNEDYAEGSGAYGVPHPGVILIDSDGKVVLKRAEEKYSDRPSMDDLLEDVKKFVAEAESDDDANAEEDSAE
ncbi:MAG: redoxin domain-containing protein [Gammaproteobacteria bacterium]|nr:redoxin domain-containing protein [Gammaproteobacteria bacterium]MYF38910.1 redoxin domain-containing protein [Gammaproteobacteria bacterium]